MKIIGDKKVRGITKHSSAKLLKQGSIFNDELKKLPTGDTTFIEKGIFRFKNHKEMNQHWIDSVVKGMAQYEYEKRIL